MVFGRGLGIKQLFLKFVAANCMTTDRRLVFCLNAGGDEEFFRASAANEGVPPERLPGIISNKSNLLARRTMYIEGGCYFITSRIMIVDLLTERANASNICGFLVLNAHRITETSMEAFILKIFKDSNPDGFIKVQRHENINEGKTLTARFLSCFLYVGVYRQRRGFAF
jgi:DNA excision repair protein ERCC-4